MLHQTDVSTHRNNKREHILKDLLKHALFINLNESFSKKYIDLYPLCNRNNRFKNLVLCFSYYS